MGCISSKEACTCKDEEKEEDWSATNEEEGTDGYFSTGKDEPEEPEYVGGEETIG